MTRFQSTLGYSFMLSLEIVFTLTVVLLLNPAAPEVVNPIVTLPKCEGSALGGQVEIHTSLISSHDFKNIISTEANQTVLINLSSDSNGFVCEPDKGRVVNLQVALHNLQVTDTKDVITFFKSGFMLHDKSYFSTKEYCLQSIISRNGSSTISVKICEPKCSSHSNTVCVEKCCEPGKVWDLKDYSKGAGSLACQTSGEKTWRPFLYQDKYTRLDAPIASSINVRYKDAHPKNFCDDGGFFLMTLKDYDEMDASPFRILKSGKVVMKVGRTFWEEVPSGVYCVDGAMNFRSEHRNSIQAETTSGLFSGHEEDSVMLVCTGFLEDPEDNFDGSPNLLYVIAMIIASVFLFLTALVYAVLWKRQNVHGWTFLGYVVSLLLTFVFLSVAHLSTGDYDCSLVGICCHFFFLSTFTWLTALNFDIYWTFRSLNPNPGRRKEILRFLCYSIFAVGLPVLIVSVALILDKIYGDDPESEVIVPRYGVTRCTMDRSADLPYLFGPISVLLGCNLILFPTTFYHIYKSQKITKLGGMKNALLKHKIKFFGKLFILAGVTWIFEVISWACTEPGKPIHWIWKMLDLVNILQAIAIFIVFVCNRKTLQDLSEKYSCLKKLNSIMEKASGAAGGNAARRHEQHDDTNVSSVFDVPGLDTIDLSVK